MTNPQADGMRHQPPNVALPSVVSDRDVRHQARLVYCWFHEFWHEYDGVTDGWMCHAWGPQGPLSPLPR